MYREFSKHYINGRIVEDIEAVTVLEDHGDRYYGDGDYFLGEDATVYDRYRGGHWFRYTGLVAFFESDGFKTDWLEYEDYEGRRLYM